MLLSLTLIRSQIVNVIRKNETKLAKKLYLRPCQRHFSTENAMERNIRLFGRVGLLRLKKHAVLKDCDGQGILLSNHDNAISVHHLSTTQDLRSNALSTSELKKAIEQLTDQFIEAREMLDDARESTGTVYFAEDMDEAQKAVVTTLEQYQTLLARLSEDQKQEVLRTIGLKMEELKAQEQSIKDSLHD